MRRIGAEDLLAANAAGRKFGGNAPSYYSPLLQVACALGANLGVRRPAADLRECPLVRGYRYGGTETGLSRNYRDDYCEFGLSLAAIEGEPEIGSSVWFADRERVEFEGFLLPFRGSDGEALILPIGAVGNWDEDE